MNSTFVGRFGSFLAAEQDAFSLIPMLECLLAKGADPAYLIYLPGSQSRSSLMVEMVTQMMLWQTQTLTEATRLLVRAVVVDEKMLTNIMDRFQRELQSRGIPNFKHRPSVKLPLLNRYRERKMHFIQQKRITKQLQTALEKLRNDESSDFLFNYTRALNDTSKHDFSQLILASHLTLLLTPGAKYHNTHKQLHTAEYEADGLPA